MFYPIINTATDGEKKTIPFRRQNFKPSKQLRLTQKYRINAYSIVRTITRRSGLKDARAVGLFSIKSDVSA